MAFRVVSVMDWRKIFGVLIPDLIRDRTDRIQFGPGQELPIKVTANFQLGDFLDETTTISIF